MTAPPSAAQVPVQTPFAGNAPNGVSWVWLNWFQYVAQRLQDIPQGVVYSGGGSTPILGTNTTNQVLAQVPLGAVDPGHGFRCKAIIDYVSGPTTGFGFCIGPAPSSSYWLLAFNVPAPTLFKISGEILNLPDSQTSQVMAPDPCFNVGANNAINNYCDSFGSIGAVADLSGAVANNMYLLVNGPVPSTAHIFVEACIIEAI